MKKIIFGLLMLAQTCFALPPHFKVLDQRTLPNGQFSHVKIAPPSDIDPFIDFYIVKLKDHYKAEFYAQPATQQSQAKFMGHLTSQKFIFAVNGGYYSREFEPVGLFIDKGKKQKRFSRNRLLNSCVLINRSGQMTLIARCEKSPDAFYAMQTGPLVIENGKIAPDTKALQDNSKVPKSFFLLHERTLLAESGTGELLVIVTSKATLPQIAEVLKNEPEVFGVKQIKTAINLDGGSSTGMLLHFKDRPFYIQEKKPVKVLVFFN